MASAFAIPKVALKLAGFHLNNSRGGFGSLEEQLKVFGGGLHISVMVAFPKGSELGTSGLEVMATGWEITKS